MGIDIVEDEDVEEELAAMEEDREVENLLWSNCQKHDRLQKGINWVSSVLKGMIPMYSTVDQLNVVSVERYKYYVQYSTWVKCRECQKML